MQVIDIEIPELESIRAAQMASVGCEIAQACKPAYSDMRKRRQMNLDSRLTLANAFSFTATDYLQVCLVPQSFRQHPCLLLMSPPYSNYSDADFKLSRELASAN